MDAVFDLIAPVVIDAVAFVVRFWPSLLVAAVVLVLARKGVRAPRLPLPPPALAYALVCALSLATSAITLHFRGEPRLPGYEDDIGYLLSADTFMHGRLTNPPHPLARHFETFYTLHQPTYSSMYLPGTGLFLALGRLIAGRALIGMWLATTLAAVAIFWALRGWVSEGWAFALACIVAVHPTMAEWSNSFLGGSVTALGGALVAGATARLRREPRTIDGVLFGAGAVLLGITRPYESLMIGVPFVVMVIASGRGWRLLKPAVVAMAITASGAAAIMVMNRAVTGDALKLPYVLYKERHTSAPLFIWQAAGPPLRIDQPEIAFIDRHYRNYHARNREPREFLRTVYAETVVLLRASIPAPHNRWSGMGRAADSLRLLELLPFAVFLLAVFRDRQAAGIGAALALELVALLSLTGFTQVHYAAPAAAAFAIALGIGFQRLASMRHEGEWLSRAAWAATLFAAVIGTAGSWKPNEVSERTRMMATLMKSPGPHLVLVAENCAGFVRNGAEIDGQRIIWARDLGANDALLQRYPGRSLWTVRCHGAGHLQFVRPPLRADAKLSYERDPFIP